MITCVSAYACTYILTGMHSMISDQEKSLDKFKELYQSCSKQEKLLCLESEISNQTLLYRLVIYDNTIYVDIQLYNEKLAIKNSMYNYIHAKQKHPGCKKSARPRRSSIVNGQLHMQQKALISTEAKKLFTKILLAA